MLLFSDALRCGSSLRCSQQYTGLSRQWEVSLPMSVVERKDDSNDILTSSLSDIVEVKIETLDNSHNYAKTINGGRRHSDASKRKISAANKGKKPWNVGKAHTLETKRRISERTKAAMAAKKMEKAQSMGFATIEEYDQQKEVDRKAAKAKKAKGGLTPEGRKRISESVKKRWADPYYRAKYSAKAKGSRAHSEETRTKISQAVKAKWQTAEYRSKMGHNVPSQEVRDRISNTLRTKWQDPEFREKMMKHSFKRTSEWKSLVSDQIKKKWQDPIYRNNVEAGIRASNRTVSSNRVVHNAHGKQIPRRRSDVDVQRKSIAKAAKAEKLQKQKDDARLYAFTLLHKSYQNREVEVSDFRSILGSELWFEEKIRRQRHLNDPILADDALSDIIAKEFDSSSVDTAVLEQVVAQQKAEQLEKRNKNVVCRAAKAGARSTSNITDMNTAVSNMESSDALTMDEALPGDSRESVTSAHTVSTSARVKLAEAKIDRDVIVQETETEAFHDPDDMGALGEYDYMHLSLDGEKALSAHDDDDDDDDGDDEEEEEDWEWDDEEVEDIIEVYDSDGNLVGTYTDKEFERLRKGK